MALAAGGVPHAHDEDILKRIEAPMGFWDWIVGKFASDPDAAVAPRGGAYRAGSSAARSDGWAPVRSEREAGVAVMDPPAGVAASAREGVVSAQEAASCAQESSEEDCWWAPPGAHLLSPPPIDPPDLSPEARTLENLLVSHFDGHDMNLPPLLHVAERVLPRLSDSKFSLPDAARILADDAVTAAAILRTANSPLYCGAQKFTALPAAVTRLGVNALRTLLLHQSMRAAMFCRKRSPDEFATVLWRRSIASATVMHGLSEFTPVDKDEAFLIGLLHDIGNIVVLRVMHGDTVYSKYVADLETFDYLCAESHQEFGELIADAWKLPDHLKRLVSDHHAFPAEDDPLRAHRLQLQLTDMIVALLGYSAYRPYNLPGSDVASALKLANHPRFTPFLRELPDRVANMVGAM